MLTETFKALQKEAQFTNEMLGSGATQIRKANYAFKGVYFQAFTSLSTGLERIGKLCFILDFYLTNNGKFPDQNYLNYLKRQVGHDLNFLYKESRRVVVQQAVAFDFLSELSHPVHVAMLEVLSAFAKGDRYSNIGLVVGSQQISDPVKEWFERVDSPLFDKSVKPAKKAMIERNAAIGEALMGAFSMVRHTAESGIALNSFEQASKATGRFEAVAPYRQLYVLQIIRYWVELLGALGRSAYGMPGEDIPYFSEMFPGFYNDDAYLRTRKTWTGL